MGTYLVTHKGTLLGQQIRNTFYYITTVGEPSDAEWQVAADEIRADWVAQMAARITSSMTLDGIDRRRVDIAGLLSFSETFTLGPIAGSNGSDPIATQVALLISNKGTTIKPNRARTYLAGFTEADVLVSQWLAAATNAGEAFVDLQSNLNGAGANPLSRVAAQWNATRTAVILTNDLSGAASVASVIPATQRRRRIGVGI
jgi:hypothetical protein